MKSRLCFDDSLDVSAVHGVGGIAGSLDEALDALEDHDYLLKGDVFTMDVIDVCLDYKRSRSMAAIRQRPQS